MMGAFDKFLNKVLVFLVFVQGMGLVILIGIEVLFRYALANALSWPEEVAGILFTWFTLIGTVLVTRSGEHIEFSSLLVRLPPGVNKALGVFNQLIIGAFAVFMVIYGYNYAMMFTFEKTPAAGINLLWLNFALPVNGLLILLYALWNILKIITRGPAEAGDS
jgi:TRAP-type C4-dicarboxylate transport system permease small subunit